MSHVHRPIPARRLPLYPANGRSCPLCHGSGHNCPECSGWDEPEDDSPYCECGAIPSIEELDTGKCDCCGRIVE
jgi:hypothetical protein